MTDSGTPAGGRTGSGTWSWLLPALTFLAGCVLGAVVVGVGVGGDEQPSASGPSAGAQASAGRDGQDGDGDGEVDDDLYVRVPASCLQGADSALRMVDRVDEVVAAVRDVDARRLQETVDEVQQVRRQVEQLASECRTAGRDSVEDASAGGAVPSPGTS